MKLGSITGPNYHKLQVEDMQQVLIGDFTDSFALNLLKQAKLQSIFSHNVDQFSEAAHEKIRLLADMLREWDGTFGADSRSAAIFHLYLRQAVNILFYEVHDKTLIDRILETYDFLDAVLRIVEEISRMPQQNQYNNLLCGPYIRYLRVSTRQNCSYLLTYALLLTHDQILEQIVMKGNDRQMDLSEVVLNNN